MGSSDPGHAPFGVPYHPLVKNYLLTKFRSFIHSTDIETIEVL